MKPPVLHPECPGAQGMERDRAVVVLRQILGGMKEFGLHRAVGSW